MEGREEFILKALEIGANKSELCRQFGISRKTGHKWLRRYKQHGLASLEDESRRPARSPLRVSAEVVAEVVRVRLAFPRFGSRKIADCLRRTLGKSAPSARTVMRILVRAGMLQPMRRRPPRPRLESKRPSVVVAKPNDLWTVDFKGWWLTRNRERCEPLTVRDAFSRFVLDVTVLKSTAFEGVKAVFEKLFLKYGLPKCIQSDNGTPFVAPNSWHGLSALSVWWASLGIEHVRSRPATPSDNGAHERMHRDIAEELQAFAAMTLTAQQQACDRWRHNFNHHRPHEALDMKRPEEVYRRSEVIYDGRVPELDYPEHFHTRLVSSTGRVSWRHQAAFLSTTLVGKEIGLELAEPKGGFHVWFAHRRLGWVDFTAAAPKLLPARLAA